MVLTKLSVLILLRRIFYIEPGFNITIYILSAILVLGSVGILVGSMLICRPLKALWEWWLREEAACGDQDLMSKVFIALWTLTDFAILVCPLPVIKNLRMNSGQRIKLYAIFLLGGM